MSKDLRLLLMAVLLLCGGCASPQEQSTSPTTWMRRFEGPDYGAFFDVVLTGDGNALTVGTTNHLHVPPYSGDALFVKFTLEGDVLWEKTWGGEGYEQAHDVVLASDEGYYVFGETDSYGAGGRDFFLLKITSDGTQDWFKTYGRPLREWPFGMLPLSNGDFLLYGFTETQGEGIREEFAVRVDKYGEILWEHIGDSSGDELVIDVLETAENDLVMVVVEDEDSRLEKLNSEGNLLWIQRYDLPGWQYASEIIPTEDGSFFLAGFSLAEGAARQADMWLAWISEEGELRRETTYGEPAYDDYTASLLPLRDGTYLVGGLGNGMPLVHLDQDGNVLWRQDLDLETVYMAASLIELDDGGFLVAGLIQITNGLSYDAILLRTDSNGQVQE